MLVLLAQLALSAAPAAPAPAAADPISLVLVVASNRSARLDRPPLQYADDDGAKYFEVFAAIAGDENVILLADLDRDTARLFPALVRIAHSPTRTNVQEAARRLAAKAAAARASGRLARLYFVFAGHGDVDRGSGFLDLADGPFTSSDLDALLRTVDAGESHVILDACNSFFVVAPRKPGGRRFATPRDVVESLARRLPNVGVFLSTSAEAEVFEWSELQSGIFSHAVRSGILGGADVNRDGRVTYEELAAFVDTSTSEIRNPLFRPRVFARGPNGELNRTLVDLSRARLSTVIVDDPGAVRLTVRDSDGLRWLDAYKEMGEVLALYFPPSLAARLEIATLSTMQPDAGRIESVRALPRDISAPVVLASLAPAVSASEPRGPEDVFRALFTRPFGPRALAAWRAEQASAPAPVFGISREDGERMRLLLGHLAASERERRTVYGMTELTAGALTATLVAQGLREYDQADRALIATSGFGIAALLAGAGVHELAVPSRGERIEAWFRQGMDPPGADQTRVVAGADTRLHALLQAERLRRQLRIDAGFVLVAGGTTLVSMSRNVSPSASETRAMALLGGALVAAAGAGLMFDAMLSDTPAEKLLDVWMKEPARGRIPTVAVAPVPDGALLVVTNVF